MDNNGIYIDNRKLYEETTTKEITFKKEKYLLSKISNIENNKTNDLSGYWIKILGNKYKVRPNNDNSLFSLIIYILQLSEFKNIINNEAIDVDYLKNKIIKYINDSKNKKNLIDLYKDTDIELLKTKILNKNYTGTEIDLEIISKIYNINFILLNKRIKKNSTQFSVIKSKNYKSDNFILLYRTNIFDKNIFNLIQFKDKLVFRYNTLPQKFSNMIFNTNNTEK
jgi:hypothetical protein